VFFQADSSLEGAPAATCPLLANRHANPQQQISAPEPDPARPVRLAPRAKQTTPRTLPAFFQMGGNALHLPPVNWPSRYSETLPALYRSRSLRLLSQSTQTQPRREPAPDAGPSESPSSWRVRAPAAISPSPDSHPVSLHVFVNKSLNVTQNQRVR